MISETSYRIETTAPKALSVDSCQLPFEEFELPCVFQVKLEANKPHTIVVNNSLQSNFLDSNFQLVAFNTRMQDSLINLKNTEGRTAKIKKRKLYTDFRDERRKLDLYTVDEQTTMCNRTFKNLRTQWTEDGSITTLIQEESKEARRSKKAEYFLTPNSIVFLNEYTGVKTNPSQQ